MNNLIVTYDLRKPGQDYADLEAAIKSLGSWAHPQQSVWYVHTGYTMQQTFEFLKKYIDSNDRLLVVDARNAVGYNNAA